MNASSQVVMTGHVSAVYVFCCLLFVYKCQVSPLLYNSFIYNVSAVQLKHRRLLVFGLTHAFHIALLLLAALLHL